MSGRLSAKGVEVELVGGPKDGETWNLKEALPEIRFALMPDPKVATMWAEDEDMASARMEYDYLIYERTRHRIGGRIAYRYVPPRK